MLGISWAEFLVIILVAVAVIPSLMWPDVARAVARVVRFIRAAMWRITDASEKLKDQIEREAPIDDIIKTTTTDMLDAVSVRRDVPARGAAKKKVKRGRGGAHGK